MIWNLVGFIGLIGQGLADVTNKMQIQRGLGASKLAIPAVGGTINILTNAAEFKKGGNVSSSIGNDGYTKYVASLSSGLSEKDLQPPCNSLLTKEMDIFKELILKLILIFSPLLTI